jgi:hypothetical protein
MRRQPERKAEVNPVVLSRVARLSSPRRAVVHRGHAEPAGDAMTRCAGARAPPGVADTYGGNDAAQYANPRGDCPYLAIRRSPTIPTT